MFKQRFLRFVPRQPGILTIVDVVPNYLAVQASMTSLLRDLAH